MPHLVAQVSETDATRVFPFRRCRNSSSWFAEGLLTFDPSLSRSGQDSNRRWIEEAFHKLFLSRACE